MPVNLDIRDHVATLTLNRPEALNALDHRLQADLETALGEVETRDDLRALVVTGAGRAFCAGSDIKDLYGVTPDEADRIVRREARVCQRIADLPIPAIAAIGGYALGGGVALALYHDIRIAAESAVLGCPEIKLGWSTPYGMSLLTRVVGRSKARELLFRGHLIDAREAHRIGLVDEVAPDGALMEVADRVAREIAAHSPVGVRALKAVLNAEEGLGVREADDRECRAFRICFDTDAARGGIRDFVEKKSKR